MIQEIREQVCRFLSPMKHDRGVLLRSLARELSLAAIPLVHIFFIQQIVVAIEQADKGYFWDIIWVYIALLVVYEIWSYFTRGRGWVQTVNTYRRVIHKEYVQKFIQLDNTVATSIGTGKMLSIINKGMDTRALQLQDFTRNCVSVFVTFVYAFVSIFVMQSWYAIIFLLAYILVHILGVYINGFSLSYRRQRYESWNGYTSRLVRIIMSKYEILQSGEVEKELNGLHEFTYGMDKANRKMKDPIHRFFTLPEAFISRTQLLVIIYIGGNIFAGIEDISTLVGLFGIFTLLGAAISKSMDFFREFTKQFTMIEYMRNFFDSKPGVEGYDSGEKFVYDSGNIKLSALSFSYEDANTGKHIFENFSLLLQGGKKTALVGPSGGGKSTLIKLIAGYLLPDEGEIVVDDQKLSAVSKKSRYAHVGYLTQEPNIFDGTIEENLLYGLGDHITLEQIDVALKLSKCEFVYDFSEGTKTMIGERGIRLSGGQRQRLAIAKIFLKNPKIILLDEPTSALDSESEKAITDAMNNLFEGRTVIIIAHRLQTVKHADDIILIDAGNVAERGTHQELMKQGGMYYTMVELQSGF